MQYNPAMKTIPHFEEAMIFRSFAEAAEIAKTRALAYRSTVKVQRRENGGIVILIDTNPKSIDDYDDYDGYHGYESYGADSRYERYEIDDYYSPKDDVYAEISQELSEDVEAQHHSEEYGWWYGD